MTPDARALMVLGDLVVATALFLFALDVRDQSPTRFFLLALATLVLVFRAIAFVRKPVKETP